MNRKSPATTGAANASIRSSCARPVEPQVDDRRADQRRSRYQQAQDSALDISLVSSCQTKSAISSPIQARWTSPATSASQPDQQLDREHRRRGQQDEAAPRTAPCRSRPPGPRETRRCCAAARRRSAGRRLSPRARAARRPPSPPPGARALPHRHAFRHREATRGLSFPGSPRAQHSSGRATPSGSEQLQPVLAWTEGRRRDQDREPRAPVHRLTDRDDAAVQLRDQRLPVTDARGDDAAVDE